jgi:flagellar basal body-associated protein FliL
MADEKSKGKDEGAKATVETAPAAAGAGGSKKKMLIIAGILIADVLLMGGVAFFIVGKLRTPNPVADAQKNQDDAEKKRREEQTRIGMTLPKPLAFTVNIATQGEAHYLKCSIQLEWDAVGEAKKGGGEGGEGGGAVDPLGLEIQKRMPKISDIIINILSSEPYQELLKASGKQKMKESIISEVNAILPEEHGRLKNAFFTDFLVQ